MPHSRCLLLPEEEEIMPPPGVAGTIDPLQEGLRFQSGSKEVVCYFIKDMKELPAANAGGYAYSPPYKGPDAPAGAGAPGAKKGSFLEIQIGRGGGWVHRGTTSAGTTLMRDEIADRGPARLVGGGGGPSGGGVIGGAAGPVLNVQNGRWWQGFRLSGNALGSRSVGNGSFL